jgi:hypothetical protein
MPKVKENPMLVTMNALSVDEKDIGKISVEACCNLQASIWSLSEPMML